MGWEDYLKVWLAAIFAVFLLAVPLSMSHVWATTTITWDSGVHALSDGRADAVGIPLPGYTVTDDSLGGGTHVISVLVNSTSDPTGIIQTLTESAPGSGTFSNTGVIFSNGTGLFDIASSQTVGVNYPSLAGTGEIICHSIACPNSIDVFSTADPVVGIVMNLTETGPATGIFTNKLHFTTGPSIPSSSIRVRGGDIVTIHDISNDDASNEIVTPNPDPSLGAVPSKFGDTVCAVYNGVEGCTVLIGGSAPGGGGGGLIRPGLVLENVLSVVSGVAGLFENVFNPPSIGNDYHHQYGNGLTIDGKAFDVKNYATTIPQQVLKTGQPASFDFNLYDERGAHTIAHAGLYFHFKGDPTVINADTWISWDKNKGIETHDPNKIFQKTGVTAKVDSDFLHLTFTMIPQKPMPDSSLIMRMWDDRLALGDVPIWGAIVIVDPNAPVPVKKIPTDQYGDYVTLEKILDSDGYYIPTMLNKLHSIGSIYNSVDVNWVYDKGVDKLTMVESDKSGNLLGNTVCDLFKKIPQPTITARNYVYIPVQLNRADDAQENAAKLLEAQKAEKLLESFGMVRLNNFESSK